MKWIKTYVSSKIEWDPELIDEKNIRFLKIRQTFSQIFAFIVQRKMFDDISWFWERRNLLNDNLEILDEMEKGNASGTYPLLLVCAVATFMEFGLSAHNSMYYFSSINIIQYPL